MKTGALTTMGLLASVSLAVSPAAEGAVYEGFDYTADTTFTGEAGGTGFPAGWAHQGGGTPSVIAQIESGSLNNDAFTFTPTGNKAITFNASGHPERLLADADKIDLSADGDAVFFSYLISTESVSSNDNQLSFFDGGTVVLDTGIRNDDFRLRSGGSAQVTTGTPLNNTTYFIVGFIDPNASSNDVFGLNVYTALDSVPTDAPDVTNSSDWLLYDSGKSLSTEIDRIVLWATGSGTGGDPRSVRVETSFDEIRLGSDWEGVAVPASEPVIPEPSSIVLAGLGALCLAKRRRR